MNGKSKKAERKVRAERQEAHPRQRQMFKTLLLSNPNYFGNLVETPYTPVFPIAGNTFYEELACVGYHPQQERLEAVVYVYQPSGYGTDICGSGSPEHVRFYLDNGSGWQDQGVTSFQAYNVPEGTDGERWLEYAASLKIEPLRRFCFFGPHIQRVRAILSWNNPPPAGQPNWTPIWGNVLDANIQVEPRRFIFWPELFEAAEIKLPPVFQEVVDLDLPVLTKAKVLTAADLVRQYEGQDVPVHRFAFKELSAFVSAKSSLSAESYVDLLPNIQIDPDIFDLLFPKEDGDVSFEELTCIGLDPNFPDTLVGVIHVKKSSGYSGGPCTDGSREYVTFWGDFDNNGSFETCLGTAQVQVYDLANIPPDGVHYAVRLPVNLEEYRRACESGPRVVPIRAILSWNAPASCANPNHVPTWGNREETLINIAPSLGAPAGKMLNIGGIPVPYIDTVTGLTTPDAKFATNNFPPDASGRPCPFAGRVTIEGFPLVGYSYIVEVSTDNSVWTPVLTPLWVEDVNGFLTEYKANPITNRFDYLGFTQNAELLLAQWDTTGNEKWFVRLSVYSGNTLQSTETRVVQLDNTAPEVSITITTGAGDCGKFPSGTLLSGTFVARDLHFGNYTLSVEPNVNPPGVGVPVPSTSAPLHLQTDPAPGNTWSLDTTGMQACGYVIRVGALDRAIVNSQAVGLYAPDSAGFCLEEPVEG